MCPWFSGCTCFHVAESDDSLDNPLGFLIMYLLVPLIEDAKRSRPDLQVIVNCLLGSSRWVDSLATSHILYLPGVVCLIVAGCLWVRYCLVQVRVRYFRVAVSALRCERTLDPTRDSHRDHSRHSQAEPNSTSSVHASRTSVHGPNHVLE
jgi:hypothetical protein